MNRSDLKGDVFFGFVVALFLLSCSAQAYANKAELHIYQEAFPGAPVKCATCHVPAQPGRDASELNEYGQAILNVSVEFIKQLGTSENFKKEQTPA